MTEMRTSLMARAHRFSNCRSGLLLVTCAVCCLIAALVATFCLGGNLTASSIAPSLRGPVSGPAPMPNSSDVKLIAEILNQKFLSSSNCTDDPLDCDGVYVRACDNQGCGWSDAWVNLSVSFSFWRHDIVQPAPYNMYRAWSSTPPVAYVYWPAKEDILCGFPFDGNSFERPDCGCGRNDVLNLSRKPKHHICKAGDEAFPTGWQLLSNKCGALARDHPETYATHFHMNSTLFPQAAYMNFYRQCTFPPDMWQSFIKVSHLTRDPRYRFLPYFHPPVSFGYNEIVLKTSKSRWLHDLIYLKHPQQMDCAKFKLYVNATKLEQGVAPFIACDT